MFPYFRKNVKLLFFVSVKNAEKLQKNKILVKKTVYVSVNMFVCGYICFCVCVCVCVRVCVQCKVGNVTFIIIIEDEWDRMKTGKDLINEFNNTFLFSKNGELEMLAEIFRIIGKRDLEHGVKSFFG